MKNKPCFWLLFLAGVFLIRLMFTVAFWYVVGYILLAASAVFFVYIVFTLSTNICSKFTIFTPF